MDLEPDLTWATVIREAIEGALAESGVSMPATVVSYDRTSQTAQVRPGLTRRIASYLDESELLFEDLPDIYAVPVLWPSGSGVGTGSSYFHPGLSAGEGVLLVCSDADFSAWLRSGARSNPEDGRTHHYAHSVAIPGLRPRSLALPSTEVVLAAGGQARSLAVADALDAFLTSFSTALVNEAAALANGGNALGAAAVTSVVNALYVARIAPTSNFFSTRIKEG